MKHDALFFYQDASSRWRKIESPSKAWRHKLRCSHHAETTQEICVANLGENGNAWDTSVLKVGYETLHRNYAVSNLLVVRSGRLHLVGSPARFLLMYLPRLPRRSFPFRSGRYPLCRRKTSHILRPVFCRTTLVESAISLGTPLRPLLSRKKCRSTLGKTYPPYLTDYSRKQTITSTSYR